MFGLVRTIKTASAFPRWSLLFVQIHFPLHREPNPKSHPQLLCPFFNVQYKITFDVLEVDICLGIVPTIVQVKKNMLLKLSDQRTPTIIMKMNNVILSSQDF